MTGVYSIVNKETNCDFASWNQTNAQVQQVIAEIGQTYDPYELLSLQYLLGAIQYLDSYFYCQKYTNSFLKYSETEYNLDSVGCSLQFKTDAWQEDPCCWTLKRWNDTCYPHLVDTYDTIYGDLNQDMVNSNCANPECTSSYLEDYKSFLEDDQNSSSCAAPKESYLVAYNAKLMIYRNCKELVWGDDATYCVQDTDCGGDYHSQFRLMF